MWGRRKVSSVSLAISNQLDIAMPDKPDKNKEARALFFHHLHDTIILLGGGTQIAKMVERYDTAGLKDVEELQRINMRLIDGIKDRLFEIHKTTVRRVDPEEEEES